MRAQAEKTVKMYPRKVVSGRGGAVWTWGNALLTPSGGVLLGKYNNLAIPCSCSPYKKLTEVTQSEHIQLLPKSTVDSLSEILQMSTGSFSWIHFDDP